MLRRVVVLGSTGSIGTQTLDVIERHPDELRLVGLAAGRNRAELCRQAERFGVRRVATYEEGGMESLLNLVRAPDVDLVVVAVAGVIGLLPTLEAIRHGKRVALASKEVLVAAGELVMPAVREAGVALTPIDSEHSAIFQCLQGYRPDQVSGLLLTASGGPFFGRPRDELREITVEQALNHPTWRMGGKITIDSATLMNKGLELIEARWLFDVPVERIEVVVHRQSVVHSMVRFTDGSVLGQMGWPDMRLPILYALLHPERPPSGLEPWDPVRTPNLTFAPPDDSAFPAINLAREAARRGDTYPCALNAANEEAANAFLRGEGSFLGITEVVERVLEGHKPQPVTLEGVLEVDAETRQTARRFIREASVHA